MATKAGVDDMVMLSKISEGAILENLHKRYDADIIYTYIGHVLIAINPYKNIENLYLERTLKDYRGKYQYELPPHVYAVADAMYRNMFSEGENQCVIISGESGAGKTVNSKHIMQFIAAVSGQSAEVQRTKDIILESNPLLEAFGNAKTVRNNNSSRFGKYMEIQFNLKGDPIGGKITNYLLEKSRVVFQAKGERNFHIFYQVFTDNQTKNDLKLGSPQDYHYIRQGNSFQVEGVDDVQEFRDTLKAMDVVGFSQEEKSTILRITGAILHLGNVTFVEGGQDNSDIKDSRAAETAATLLQVPFQSLKQSLLFRTINTGGAGKRGSTYACPNNVEAAEYSRDALAKALYSKMFDWIVNKVNEGLYFHDPDAFSIGVLDIYGFEIFEKNGFEQLCINYVNEKLQQIFIQLTLKAEQEEYGKEGIPWENIDYFNNKICCDLIESKRNPIGVLSLLDDVCNFPKGTDDKFLGKLGETYMQHAHFSMAGQHNEFTIKHYAGDVTYNVDGFCDKNKDFLFNDLIELGSVSQSNFIRNLFPEVSTMDKKRPTTAGFKIKTSIGELVEALSKCQPHYVRCIKPNEKKARNNFDEKLTMHQVRYLGLLENVRVRRAGFAYRQFYDKFFYRYRVCSENTWPRFDGDMKSGTAQILRILNLSDKEYANGATKIFIRNPETVFSLEEMRERKVESYANRIQRFFGRFALRRYYWELQMAGNNAIAGKKERRRLSFERAYVGDYINYRENFALKRMVEQYGREKMHFADNCTKYDRRSKRQRRIILMSEKALYIIHLDKNQDKDKLERAKKPFVYYLKRRLEFNQIKSVVLSSYQDNFFLLNIGIDHDNLLECRRKIELCSYLKKIGNVNIEVNDTMSVLIKGGKRKVVKFGPDPKAGDGKMKGGKVGVAPGMSRDSKPNLPEPKQIETHNILPQRNLERKAIAAPPGRGGGGGGGYAPAPVPAAAPRPVSRGGPPIPRGGPPTPRGGPTPPVRGGFPRGGPPIPMPGARGRGRGY